MAKPRIQEIQFGRIHLDFNRDGSIDLTFNNPDKPARIEQYNKGRVTNILTGLVFRVVPEHKIPDDTYVADLQNRLSVSGNCTERYRVVAELEDIADGHWDGPRTDDPPENWS